MMALPAILSLLRRFWAVIPILGLLISLFITRATLERRTEALADEKVAHAKFVADVRDKTELARISDAANKARVERDQHKVTMEASSDYQKQLADLRRRYDERVRLAAKGGSGGGRGKAVPGVPDAAGGSDATAAEDRLPLDDALIASEQALQLRGLQDWIRAQQGVER